MYSEVYCPAIDENIPYNECAGCHYLKIKYRSNKWKATCQYKNDCYFIIMSPKPKNKNV